MFVLSQLVEWFLWPANLLLLLLIAGAALLWRGRARGGRMLVTIVAAALAVLTIFPVDQWLAWPLESAFVEPQPRPQHVDGILILSGDFRRVVQAGAIARLYPDARIVYSGGPGALTPDEEPSDYARAYLKGIGVNLKRLTTENASENTWQNFVFSKRMIKPKPSETWILLTSAVHMPRAMGIARRVAWKMTPWPVNHIADPTGQTYWNFDLVQRLYNVGAVLHEYAALVIYRVRDRTDALFPHS